jgi:predicted permease
MRGLGTDARHALRSVSRGRGLVVAAVVTFALGVAVNVVVLSLIDRLLFRPLPFAEPDRLVHIHLFARSDVGLAQAFMPFVMSQALAARTDVFEGVSWADGWVAETAAIPGESPLRLTPVRANALDVLGVVPALGRSFSPVDADDGRQRPVLLTAETWQRAFRGSDSVLHLSWQAGPFTYRVVGVLPPGFLLPSSHLLGRFDGVFAYRDRRLEMFPRGPLTVAPFARLRRGVSIQAAQVVANQVSTMAWEATETPTPTRQRLTVLPLQTGFTILVRPYLWLLTAAVWTVFAVAVVNLAVLLLTWGRWRADDAVVRLALGASPSRLFRMVFLEASVICTLGALAGWVTYLGLQSTVLHVVPSVLKGFAVGGWDSRLLVATAGFACCGAVAAGIFPALASRRTSVVQILNARSAGGGGTSSAVTRIVLAVEAMLGVAVVVGGALTIPPFVSLLVSSPGFAPQNLFALDVGHGIVNGSDALPDADTDRRRAVEVLDVLRVAPGVVSASASLADPLEGQADPTGFWKDHGLDGRVLAVASDFLRTFGTKLVAGRDFTVAELDATAPVAVVNETGARLLWPGEAPSAAIGRVLRVGIVNRTIVGVHEDMRQEPGAPVSPTLQVPIGSRDVPPQQSGLPVLLRMEPGRRPDPAYLKAMLDRRFGPGSLQVESVDARLEPLVERPRFLAALLGVLGGVTLFLMVVALHAVTSFEVARRRREAGIRIALGATTTAVRRGVLAVTVWPVAVGVTAGFGLACWAVLEMPRLLPAGKTGLWEIALSAIGVLGVGLVAAWVPTRLMARINPAVTLRVD